MADQDNKAELDKIMGKPSGFHTSGPSTPAASPEPTPEHKLGASMVDHLKGLLGISGKEIIGGTEGSKPATVGEAVNNAVAGVKANPDTNEYP